MSSDSSPTELQLNVGDDQFRIYAIDGTGLNILQSCRRKYLFNQILRYVPISKGPALDKGDIIHYMLQKFYEARMEREKEYGNIVLEVLDLGRKYGASSDLPPAAVEEVAKSFREYTSYYREDRWVPIAVEQPFSRVLYKDDHLILIYEGKVDVIMRTMINNQPRDIIVDHKSGSHRRRPLSLSNQFMGYAWGLQELIPSRIVVVNKIGFQKTLKPAERFNRHSFEYEQERLEEWRMNTIYWMKRLIYEHIDKNFFDVDLTSCDKYSGCEYASVCDAVPKARDWRLRSEFKIGDKHDVFKVKV